MNHSQVSRSFKFQRGFTLVELVIVIVLLGILAVYAVMSGGPSPAEMTLPSQARRLAADIRHAQTLAMTSGNAMRFTIAAGSYSAGCIPPGGCTTAGFSHNLEKGAALTGTTSLDFNTRGEPGGSASYTISVDGSQFLVNVEALTGFVTVTP